MNENFAHFAPYYLHAVEHVDVGIHAVDTQGNTIIYNEKMKQLEGYTLNSRKAVELFDFTQHNEALNRVLQTGQSEGKTKLTYLNKDGYEVTTVHDTFPVYEKEILVGAVQLVRDVTSFEKLIHMPLHRYNTPITFDVITAISKPMEHVKENAKKAAQTNMPLLLMGEQGTGKDLVAEAIHYSLMPTRDYFMTFYGSYSYELMATQLEQLLTTGKSYTLYFENIELLSIAHQQHLLATLQQLKSEQYLAIASLSSDPIDCISDGKLLKELYYYFAAITIAIPPLRERKEDIEPFVLDYCRRHRERFGSNLQRIDDKVKTLFLHYDWPGNLKELELLLDEMAAVVSKEQTITLSMLPMHFRFKAQQTTTSKEPDFFIRTEKQNLLPLEEFFREAESYYIEHALQGNITKTAAALQMSRQNLQYRLRKMKSD